MPGIVLNQWFSKCGDLSITQELGRCAHSHIPAQVNCVTSSGGAQRSVFNEPSR